MKNDTLILIGAAAAGLYFISRVAKGMGKSASPASTGAGRAVAVPKSQIPNADMTLAQQYQEYGFGHSVADVYDQSGYLGTTK